MHNAVHFTWVEVASSWSLWSSPSEYGSASWSASAQNTPAYAELACPCRSYSSSWSPICYHFFYHCRPCILWFSCSHLEQTHVGLVSQPDAVLVDLTFLREAAPGTIGTNCTTSSRQKASRDIGLLPGLVSSYRMNAFVTQTSKSQNSTFFHHLIDFRMKP